MKRFKDIAYGLIVFSNTIFAAGYQIFPTLAFENSATLNTTKEYTFMLGATDFGIGMKYIGSVDNITGTAVSDTNIALPYLRFAARLDPKRVISFDVSHPILSNIQYPADSLVSSVAIDDIIKDTNYSPKISYQITDTLAMGAGLDINQVSSAQVNFGAPTVGKMTNKTSGFRYGWDVGLAWQVGKTNFLNLSYYSDINFPNLTGYSLLCMILHWRTGPHHP